MRGRRGTEEAFEVFRWDKEVVVVDCHSSSVLGSWVVVQDETSGGMRDEVELRHKICAAITTMLLVVGMRSVAEVNGSCVEVMESGELVLDEMRYCYEEAEG